MKGSKDVPKIDSSCSRAGEGSDPTSGAFYSILVPYLGSYPVRLTGGCFPHAAHNGPTVKFADSSNLGTQLVTAEPTKFSDESTRAQFCCIHTCLYLAVKFRSRGN